LSLHSWNWWCYFHITGCKRLKWNHLLFFSFFGDQSCCFFHWLWNEYTIGCWHWCVRYVKWICHRMINQSGLWLPLLYYGFEGVFILKKCMGKLLLPFFGSNPIVPTYCWDLHPSRCCLLSSVVHTLVHCCDADASCRWNITFVVSRFSLLFLKCNCKIMVTFST
jgi:hypothetical protein